MSLYNFRTSFLPAAILAWLYITHTFTYLTHTHRHTHVCMYICMYVLCSACVKYLCENDPKTNRPTRELAYFSCPTQCCMTKALPTTTTKPTTSRRHMHNMWACPRLSVGGNSVYRLCLQVAPKIQKKCATRVWNFAPTSSLPEMPFWVRCWFNKVLAGDCVCVYVFACVVLINGNFRLPHSA